MKTVIGSLAATTLVLLIAGCGKQEASPPPQGPVAFPLAQSSLAVAAERTIQPGFEHPGVIEAIQEARIRPEVAATVTAIHFAAGDIVEAGQLLMELDTADYQSQVDAAEAELMSARASAEQAETNWARAGELKPKGFISEFDYDKARASREMAAASVAKAKASLDRARLDLEDTRLTVPFAGRISKPRVAVGDYVAPAGQPLFELVQLDPIYATASVSQKSYNKYVILRAEMESRGIEIPELELSLELVGGLDYMHRGKFENWSHSSSQGSGMITGRARFPNPDGMLLPGENVTIIGRTIEKVTRTVVPQAAVLQDQQGHYVMILDEQNVAQRRNLQMGIREGSDWVVREGLEPGVRVVVTGAQALRPGTQVTVTTGSN